MRTAAAILWICPALCAATSDNGEFFEMRVRPLLVKNCYGCHTGAHMGGLQLDTREHILKGGNSGPAVVPGDPAHSLLIQAVQYKHERFKMPPTYFALIAENRGDREASLAVGSPSVVPSEVIFRISRFPAKLPLTGIGRQDAQT